MANKKEFLEELRQMSVKELVQKRKELKKELFKLKMQNQAGALKQTHLIKQVRRNITRVNTLLTQKIKEQYPSQAKKR